MAAFAVLCPGQGRQSPEMFDFALADAAGRAVLGEFEQALGTDLRAVASSGVGLFDNAFAQPAIVAVARAVWASLAPRLLQHGMAPAMFAGYSVGEVAAWSCAGAWDTAGSAEVVRVRAALMDAASPAGFGMLAVLGLPQARVAQITQRHGQVHCAIVNDEDHVVLAGPLAALGATEREVRALGASTRLLDVRLPSHTPLMAAAAQAFADHLASHSWGAVSAPVLRGVDGRQMLRPADGARALSRAVAEPIRWVDCMREMIEAGVTVALELGPGSTLSKLFTDAHPGIAARSVADFRSADGVVAWMQRQLAR